MEDFEFKNAEEAATAIMSINKGELASSLVEYYLKNQDLIKQLEDLVSMASDFPSELHKDHPVVLESRKLLDINKRLEEDF